MKSHHHLPIIVASAVLGVLVSMPLLRADAKKPKHTVSDVLKAVHKGEDNIGKRVARGEASTEDLAKMLEYYESLPANEPPRGPKDSWAAKTSQLLSAARAVKAGTPGALDQYKQASNCKACHNTHKPE